MANDDFGSVATREGTMSALLESLDENQRRVALALVGPVRVLAGAGSGKTRAITHRIAYGVETGVYSPEKVLALSFTSKAAGEMKSRLANLGVTGVACRTFHSAALAQLGHFWPDRVGGASPNVRASKAMLLSQAAEQLRLPSSAEVIRAVAAEIEWRKVRLISPEAYRDNIATRQLPSGLSAEALVAVMERYESLKDDRRELDFEDVLTATLGLLISTPWAAEQVRERYRFLVVDEYQDVSPVQRALIEAWRGTRSDVCVVGDPNQTIYSFAGANAEYLLGFEREFPEARTIELDTTYRSTPEIVHVANALVPESPLELVAVRPSGPGVRFVSAPTDAAEAAAVAADIRRAIDSGVPAKHIAVLYRINAQSLALESALGAAGVPFRVRGARFFQEESVRRLMTLIGAMAETEPATLARDGLALVLREHFNWISKPPANPIERQSWDVLAAVHALADTAAPTATVRDLRDELRRRAADDLEPAIDAVTLSTVHAAKGLEWDTVFVIGLSEGLFPLAYATSEAALAEERRLTYVAVTRAERSLTMSWAERAHETASVRTRSRFIPQSLG
jgi:DNA helicase-2/ATP-dependent DNA helicase PcrA